MTVEQKLLAEISRLRRERDDVLKIIDRVVCEISEHSSVMLAEFKTATDPQNKVEALVSFIETLPKSFRAMVDDLRKFRS